MHIQKMLNIRISVQFIFLLVFCDFRFWFWFMRRRESSKTLDSKYSFLLPPADFAVAAAGVFLAGVVALEFL